MGLFASKRFAALGAIALLSACGGSGGRDIPAVRGGGTSPQPAAQATLRVTIPAQEKTAGIRRKPAYVSWSTQSIAFTYVIGSTTYPAQSANVSPSSPNCTQDQHFNTTCTLTFGAAPGAVKYTVSAYDGQNGTGKLLSTAASSMNVVAGQDNQFDVTLSGVVGGFSVAFTTPNNDGGSIPAGTAADVPVAVNATDADGGLIGNSPQWLLPDGSPVTAATLTITGDPSEFSLKQNGSTLAPSSGTTYTIAAPFTGLSLHYNGGLYQTATLTVGAGSATGQGQLHVRPVLDEFAAPSGNLPSYGQLVVGPDGNVWFAECDRTVSRVGRVTPSGAVSEYPLQNNTSSCGITSAGGKLWLSELANCSGLCGIQEMATDGTIVSRLPVYQGTCDPYPTLLATDASGNVWYDNSACGIIGYLPSNAPSLEQHFFVSSAGSAMVSGADGNIWYVADDGNYTFHLGKISTSGVAQTYSIPQSGTGSTVSLASRSSDKTMLVDHQDGSFDSVTPAGTPANLPNGLLNDSVIATGNDGTIYAMVNDGFGNVEFDTVASDGTLGRSSFYGSPSIGIFPNSFIAGPAGSNTFWFFDGGTGKIARITLGR